MSHLVFVYGTLRRGKSNNRLLSGARFVGPAQTAESYGMNRDGIPFVYRDAPKGYAAPIRGELYVVNDETLARLDALEHHPQWYCRAQVSVDGPDGSVEAWLYFMPITHKTAANDLFKRPRYVRGAPCHTWGD